MISLPTLRRLARWGTAACGILVLILSLLPDLPSQGPPGTDKIAHIIAYFVLAAIAAVAVSRDRRSWLPWGLTVLAVVAYGGLIEVVQGFVGRNTDLWDLAGDAAGAIGGALAAAGLLSLVRRAGAQGRSDIRPGS